MAKVTPVSSVVAKSSVVAPAQPGKPSVEEQAKRVAAEQAVIKETPEEATARIAKATADAAAPVPSKRKQRNANKVAHPSLAGDAKLADVPSDFNPKLHKGLKPSNFADKSGYVLFKAWKLDRRIAAMQARSATLRKEAADMKLLANDPQAALKLKKAKLMAALATLDAEMATPETAPTK